MTWLYFAAGTLGLAACFALLEFVVRRKRMNSEVTRRIAHVVACFFGLLVYSLFDAWVVAVLSIGFAALMLLSRGLRLLSSIHQTRRRSLGEVYLPLGIGLAALIAQQDAAAFWASVLILGLADVAAGVTGDVLRSPRKTWWGTLAFALVASIVALACGYAPLSAVMAGVVLALVERFSSRGTDNVTIPLASALLLVFAVPALLGPWAVPISGA